MNVKKKMQMKQIKRSLAVALLSAAALAVNAQEQQTYSGEFGRNNEGTATYTYYTNSEGRRMFDGKYSFKKTDSRNGGATYTEVGQYKDDKLEGLWTLSFSGNLQGEKTVLKVTLNYKDGLLDGPMHFSKKVTSFGKTTTEDFTFQFHAGYLTGKGERVLLDEKYFHTYQFDENDLPVGIWKKKLNQKSIIYTEYAVYKGGQQVQSYYETDSTGDRTDTSDDRFFFSLLEGINHLLMQPYNFKEMPIRSSLKGIEGVIYPRFDDGMKFGFLGIKGFVRQ